MALLMPRFVQELGTFKRQTMFTEYNDTFHICISNMSRRGTIMLSLAFHTASFLTYLIVSSIAFAKIQNKPLQNQFADIWKLGVNDCYNCGINVSEDW